MRSLPKAPVTGKRSRKIPQMMQMEALECGATCLGMISAYYGLWLTPEKLRLDCNVSRNGATAKSILLAARSYGFEAKAYRMELRALREKGEFPCIVFLKFGHFIVLRGFKGGKVFVNDPARGEVEIPFEDFKRDYSGVVIMVKPGESFAPSGSRPTIYGYLRKHLSHSKSAIAFCVCATALVGLISLAWPLYSQWFVDDLADGEISKTGILFFLSALLLCASEFVATYLSTLGLRKATGKLAAVGSSSLMWRILHMPQSFFAQRTIGDLSSRIDMSEKVANNLLGMLAPVLINFLTGVVCLVLMFRYSITLAVIGVFSAVFKACAAYVSNKKRLNFTRVETRESARLSAATVAGIHAIESIKASGSTAGFFRQWSGYQANANAQHVGYDKLDTQWGVVVQIVSGVMDALVVAGGIVLISQGNLTMGGLLGFQGMAALFAAPVETFINLQKNLLETQALTERIVDIENFELDPLSVAAGSVVPENGISGALVVDDVTFGYDASSEPLIQNLSFEITPGQLVAFVGPSGCGKSTIAKMIAGLQSPWGGEIRLDGIRLEDLSRPHRCACMAFVDQEISLFEDTVSENIRLWDKSITESDIRSAAKDACIDADILQRSGGYNHVLTNGGSSFSGGQRQRIEIARALAQNPTLLVLDEATSALDSQTELQVLEAIKKRGITTVLVTHRLSAIRDCDQIIVIDHGSIVERGTHEQLANADGIYSQLVVGD